LPMMCWNSSPFSGRPVQLVYTSFISLDPWRFLLWLEIFGSHDGMRHSFYNLPLHYSGWITP
jgi:hypothetical protein